MIYRIWTRARFPWLLEWQAGWIHPDLHGTIPTHSVDNLTFHLMLLRDFCRQHNLPLFICTLDYSKLFDAMPHWLVNIAVSMGLPTRLAHPISDMVGHLLRYYSTLMGVCPPHTDQWLPAGRRHGSDLCQRPGLDLGQRHLVACAGPPP